MFKTRLLSGIVLVIILIATVGIGGNLLLAVLGIVSLIGLSELYKVVEVQNKPIGYVGYLATVVYYGMLFAGQMEHMTMFTILYLVILMAVYVFSFPDFSRRTGHDSVFWIILCGCDAVLCIPDQNVV